MTGPTPGVALSSLAWPEVEALFQRTPPPIVVLPVGAAAKEHGLHLPMNNDALLADYLTQRVLAARPVVALPGLPYGFYPAFVEYPGSVTLRREVFRDVVVDIGRSIHRHGPSKLYVLNTGVSTSWSLEPDEANPGGLTRDPDAARGTYSPTGAWGDPTLATLDKGRLVVEALVTHIVEFLDRFARPDFAPTPPIARYLGPRAGG